MTRISTPLSKPVSLALTLVAVVCAPRWAEAEPQMAWRAGDPVTAPNPNVIIDADPVSAPRPARAPREMDLEGGIGAAHLSCPMGVVGCDARVGAGFFLAWHHRPLEWFSWGVAAHADQYSQGWQYAGEAWTAEREALTVRLLSELHPLGWSVLDPYIGVTLGGGAVREKVAGGEQALDASSWNGSPLYGARAGLRANVGERWVLGAVVDWTKLRANTGEVCPWTVGGVCTSSGWTAFSPDNSLWNAAVTVAFTFGDEL